MYNKNKGTMKQIVLAKLSTLFENANENTLQQHSKH